MTKRVLLVGGAGFIGHHMVEYYLENTDWELTILDGLTYAGEANRLTDIENYDPDRVNILWHDLRAPIGEVLETRLRGMDYVINLASDSHVDQSIQRPVDFIHNNVMATLNLLEWARNQDSISAFVQISTDEVYGPAPNNYSHREWDSIIPSNPYSASKASQEAIAISYWRTYGVPVIITNCWSMDTRLWTQDGFKSYEEVKPGDLVWTMGDDEVLCLEPVLEKVRMPGSGTMVQIKNEKVDQLVTLNHRMFIKRLVGSPRRSEPMEEVLAADLLGLKGRVEIPVTGTWVGNDQPTYRPVDLADLGPTINGKGLPEDVSAEWLAEIFGWHVSEGHIAGTTVALAGGSVEQKRVLANLLKYVDTENVYENGRSMRLANGQLANLLNESGHLAENKRIPRFILDMAPKYLELFWAAAMAGDGSIQTHANGAKSRVYYTKSWTLAQQMVEVGQKIGYSARISKRETWNPTKTAKARSYIVRFRKPTAYIEAKHIAEVPYGGDVWCVRVPSGRVFTERHGITTYTGQTMNNYGERQYREKFIPACIRSILTRSSMPVYAQMDRAYGYPVAGSRVWLHAKEHADAIMWILNGRPPSMYSDGSVRPDRYNIAGDKDINNLDLLFLVSDILGLEAKFRFVDFHSSRPGHDMRYSLNNAKLDGLGWKQPYGIDSGLERTVRWYVDHKEWLGL